VRPLHASLSAAERLPHQILGTPNEVEWPTVVELPEFKAEWGQNPQPRLSLDVLCPKLDASGLALITEMLQYDPAKRITAKNALKHPYFDDLPPEIKTRSGIAV
jgi:serine/threonine protein kinase